MRQRCCGRLPLSALIGHGHGVERLKPAKELARALKPLKIERAVIAGDERDDPVKELITS